MTRGDGGLTRRTLSGLFWTAWGKGAYTALKLLVLAVMARLLSPADFGVVSAALVVIGFSTIFSHLGLGPALVQRAELEPRHLDTAFTTSLLFGTLLAVLIWLGAPAAAQALRIERVEPVLRALAWVFPLQGLAVAAESRLRRELRFQWLANLEVVTYGIGYGVVGIGLALAGWGVWALVTGQIAQTVLRSGVLLFKQPPRWRHLFELRAFRELMYFGGGFTVAKAANYLALQADNLVVGRFLGPQALGFYGRAYSLMAAPAQSFGTVLDQVLFPTLARIQHDPERLGTAYRRGVVLLGLITLAPSAALILLGPEVVAVILGPGWAPTVAPFQILAIGMLFRTSYKMSDSIARSTGAVYRRAWRQIAYAALVIVGAWVGQQWGIAGVAWGTLGALTVNFLLMAELGLEIGGMTWMEFWRAHVPALRLTVATFPFVWATTAALRRSELPAPLVLAVALAAGAVSALLLCRRAPNAFLGADGQWILNQLRGFRPGSRGRAPYTGKQPAYGDGNAPAAVP